MPGPNRDRGTENWQTVWREGFCIRDRDGRGYGDIVSDEQIRGHIDTQGADPEFVAFAEAVLAIRAFERAASGYADA